MSKQEKNEKNRDIQKRANKAPVVTQAFEYAKEQKDQNLLKIDLHQKKF